MSETGDAPDGSPERCGSCGSASLTRLPMVLTDGTDVLFVSCHACEQRQWLTDADGVWSALPIESVLARAQKPPR
jgi:hypothetical protein